MSVPQNTGDLRRRPAGADIQVAEPAGELCSGDIQPAGPKFSSQNLLISCSMRGPSAMSRKPSLT